VVQNYFLKLWACAALDPATGRKIEVRFAGKVNLQQDKITIKAAKSLDEIAGIEKTDVNDVEDPNNLWQ
jgi:hypothetical protein